MKKITAIFSTIIFTFFSCKTTSNDAKQCIYVKLLCINKGDYMTIDIDNGKRRSGYFAPRTYQLSIDDYRWYLVDKYCANDSIIKINVGINAQYSLGKYVHGDTSFALNAKQFKGCIVGFAYQNFIVRNDGYADSLAFRMEM